MSFVSSALLERGDGLEVGVLEERALAALELDQVAEVSCVEEQLLLARLRLPGNHPRRHRPVPTGDPLDDGEQLERPERLQEERIGAAEVVHVVATGQEHDPDVAGLGIGLQHPAEDDPVDPRHADVEHDHVGPLVANRERRLRGVARLAHLDGNRLEGRPEQSPEAIVVVYEQQAHRHSPRSSIVESSSLLRPNRPKG